MKESISIQEYPSLNALKNLYFPRYYKASKFNPHMSPSGFLSPKPFISLSFWTFLSWKDYKALAMQMEGNLFVLT